MLPPLNTPTKMKIKLYAKVETEDGIAYDIDLNKQFLRRGSPLGFLFEDTWASIIEEHYEHETQSKLFDYRHRENNDLLEAKTANQDGLKLAPSSMYGAGRKLDLNLYHQTAIQKNFLLGDMSRLADYGEITALHITGQRASEIGPNINARNTALLFKNG
jgi:hypothetical protein